ncbi:hypothetical protein V8E36_000988 [Tilletia maclaganii]
MIKIAAFSSSAALVAAALIALSATASACNHDDVRRATLINNDPVQRAAIHARHAHSQSARAASHHGNNKRQSSRQYPPQGATPPRSMTPKEWLDALDAAEQSGKIPNIPRTTMNAAGVISYPAGTNVQQVCSWTQTNCFGQNDVSKAPDGYWMLNFDDGPNIPSPTLYSFLNQNQKSATFFLIGSNIAGNPDVIRNAQASGVGHWGVHTWSHTVQTTLSNADIVAELGWTMQIIYDLTGRIPRYWRPPQGDADNRVRAVAEEVFGLTAVMWDQECNDWCTLEDGSSGCPTTTPGRTQKTINDAIEAATKLPKSPGVILLEHDLTTYSIGAFENHAWPGIVSGGWNAQPIGNFPGEQWYANSQNGTSQQSSQTSMLRSAQVAVSGGGGSSNNGGSGSSTSSTSTRGGSSTRSSSSGTAGATSGASNTGAAVQASTARLGSIGALLAVVVGAAALV